MTDRLSDAVDSIDGLLTRNAPDGIAFYDNDTPVTYGDWLSRSQHIAALLRQQDICAGERVAVWLPNQRAFLDVFVACAMLGVIAVAVNTRFKSHEVQDIVGRSGARLLITDFEFATVDFASILSACDPDAFGQLRGVVSAETSRIKLAPELQQFLDRSKTSLIRLTEANGLAADNHSHGAADKPCIIFTTSGTTSAPKFVLHDQGSLVRHGHQVSQSFGFDRDAVLLMAPPLCGVFGLAHVCAALVNGIPWVMYPVWNANTAAEAIHRYGVTHFNATDDALDQLLATTDATIAFPSVRFAGTAAFNPALADIVDRADARGLKLVGLYGASEIQALAARQYENDRIERRKLAGGQLVDSKARVRARDPDTGRICPNNEPGELEFWTPMSRMREYYGNQEATAQVLDADGWYRSGDLGYTEGATRFVYLERLGDAMRLGGFLTSPLEIENLILTFDAIDSCQVVAVNTPKGPRAFAYVIAKADAVVDGNAVIRALGSQLARYKVPVAIEPIDHFPVTEGTNAVKIQKSRLRNDAQRRVDNNLR